MGPKGSRKNRTMCCCACCGADSEHDCGTCEVAMQFGDGAQTCMVYQADHPPQGNCKSAIEALIVANHVHEEEDDSVRWDVTKGFTMADGAEPLEGWWCSGRNGASRSS